MNVIAKKVYHTSMLIQMVGKPHNCTSFKGHFLENGLKPVVCHHVNEFSGKSSMTLALEIQTKLHSESIHMLPLSGSSVNSSMKQTVLTDSPIFA